MTEKYGEFGEYVLRADLDATLKEMERPSVISAAIRAAGDPDMEWWNKGWTAAVKRMRAALTSISEGQHSV